MITPKLRFKEFSGEWESQTLGSLLELKNGINASKEQYGKGIKYISVMDIFNNTYITYDAIVGSVDIDEATFKKNEVAYGDVIFQRSSETREEIGTSNVYLDKTRNATFGGFVIRGKKIGQYNPLFLHYLLKTRTARKKVIVNGAGAQHFNIGQDAIASVELQYPKMQEQDKISELFFLVDEKISNQMAEIKSWEIQRNGFVQRIFRQELSFKDDTRNTFPAWKKMALGDFLYERKEYSQKDKDFPHVTLSKDGIYVKGERYNRDFLVTTGSKEYKVTHQNDICYNPANLKFGVICVNDFGSAIFSPIYITFEVSNTMDSRFLGYYFPRWDFINRVRKYEEGTVYERMAVNPNDFLLHVDFFPSLPEQLKIVDFLSAYDKKIESEKQILIHWQNIKKGLLQQMFV